MKTKENFLRSFFFFWLESKFSDLSYCKILSIISYIIQLLFGAKN